MKMPPLKAVFCFGKIGYACDRNLCHGTVGSGTAQDVIGTASWLDMTNQFSQLRADSVFQPPKAGDTTAAVSPLVRLRAILVATLGHELSVDDIELEEIRLNLLNAIKVVDLAADGT